LKVIKFKSSNLFECPCGEIVLELVNPMVLAINEQRSEDGLALFYYLPANLLNVQAIIENIKNQSGQLLSTSTNYVYTIEYDDTLIAEGTTFVCADIRDLCCLDCQAKYFREIHTTIGDTVILSDTTVLADEEFEFPAVVIKNHSMVKSMKVMIQLHGSVAFGAEEASTPEALLQLSLNNIIQNPGGGYQILDQISDGLKALALPSTTRVVTLAPQESVSAKVTIASAGSLPLDLTFRSLQLSYFGGTI
jgi:hypothetical protein